jgi:hypothetical protein
MADARLERLKNKIKLLIFLFYFKKNNAKFLKKIKNLALKKYC